MARRVRLVSVRHQELLSRRGCSPRQTISREGAFHSTPDVPAVLVGQQGLPPVSTYRTSAAWPADQPLTLVVQQG